MADDTTRSRDDRAAVDKAVSLLKSFGQEANLGVGVSELARRASLSKSTAFRLLGMLERNGVVEKAGSAYRLGKVIQDLGARVNSPEHDRLRELVTPYLADLYELTHRTVQLGALHGIDVVYLNKLEGHQRLRTPARIGGRMPAYCTAVGKTLLAHDEAAVEQTLAHPLRAWTPRTIADHERLRAELEHVRRAGVAVDRGETLDTLACVAAPVIGPDGRPIAAISISGDAATFNPAAWEHALRQVAAAAGRTAKAVMSRAQPHTQARPA